MPSCESLSARIRTWAVLKNSLLSTMDNIPLAASKTVSPSWDATNTGFGCAPPPFPFPEDVDWIAAGSTTWTVKRTLPSSVRSSPKPATIFISVRSLLFQQPVSSKGNISKKATRAMIILFLPFLHITVLLSPPGVLSLLHLRRFPAAVSSALSP